MDMTPEVKDQCQILLDKLKTNKNGEPFLAPVDYIALKIPDYPEKIKNPMDISTAENKLKSDEYKSLDEFKDDILLIFSNCQEYNPSKSIIWKMSGELKRYFLNNFKKVEEKFLASSEPMEEREESLSLILELSSKKYSSKNWPFLQPVDIKVVKDYLTVVKTPMDLRTIKEKIEKNFYKNKKEVIEDVELILKNCFAFNERGSQIYEIGKSFERLFNRIVKHKKLKSEEISKKINDLKNKINSLSKEIVYLEEELQESRIDEGKESEKKTFNFEQRAKIASIVSSLQPSDAFAVAKIINEHDPDFDIYGKEVVEIDFKLLRDNILDDIIDSLKNFEVVDKNLDFVN